MISLATSTSFSYDYSTQLNSNQTKENSNTSFNDMLKDISKKSKLEIENEKSTVQIKAFFEDMKKYGGAIGYVIRSNLDKIEKLIEEKKEELKDKLGLNNSPPLTGDALEQALKELNRELDDYKKELIKKLEEQRELDRLAKIDSSLTRLLHRG